MAPSVFQVKEQLVVEQVKELLELGTIVEGSGQLHPLDGLSR